MPGIIKYIVLSLILLITLIAVFTFHAKQWNEIYEICDTYSKGRAIAGIEQYEHSNLTRIKTRESESNIHYTACATSYLGCTLSCRIRVKNNFVQGSTIVAPTPKI
jgi:hypothetical protein